MNPLVLKIALFAVWIGREERRRAGKGRRRGKGRTEEGEGSKEKGREGKSISLYILPPPDRPHLQQILVLSIE